MKILEKLRTLWATMLMLLGINIRRFIANKRADDTNRVIYIIIALFVAGVMLPSALVALASGNYTGVDPSVKIIATVLLPVLGVLAVALIFLERKRGRGG